MEHRFLKEGDIIQAEDQIRLVDGRWVTIEKDNKPMIGQRVPNVSTTWPYDNENLRRPTKNESK